MIPFLKTLVADVKSAVILVLVAVLLVVSVAFKLHSMKLSKEKGELQNAMAMKDQTIEVQKGLNEKLALHSSDVESLLDSSNQQVQELKDELKKTHEQLDSATTVSLSWKKAYEGLAAASQATVPNGVSTPPGGTAQAGRTEVDFSKDFGFIGVTGYTRTNPAEAWVSVKNLRPLKLTVALSQDRQGAWHAYASSSEDNVGADIQVSAVNPSIRDIHWYERIGLMGSVGFGDGVLAGAGPSLDIGKFTLGPMAWITAGTQVSKFYGASFTWRPFAR